MSVSVLILLICAVMASLALGVLLAYGICVLMFQIFRVHAQQVATSRVVATTVPLEG